MRRMRFLAVIFMLPVFLFGFVPGVRAQVQPPTDSYHRATVLEITDEGVDTVNGVSIPHQTVRVRFTDGNLTGTEAVIEHGTLFTIDKSKFVSAGDPVVVVRTTGPDGTPVFQIVDRYRLNALIPVLTVFAVLVILLSGWRGIGSVVGMAISVLVIAGFIVPRILSGSDPLTVSIAGSLFIMVTTIYLAHGLSAQTTVALVSTFFSLLITGGLSVLFVGMTHLTGLGTEDAYMLKLGPTSALNFRGLLLGGIIIGVLGVLDDVTTGLSAALFEIKKANPAMRFHALFTAGLRVGREHVSSLVNTLVLAYAGASLPMFITLVVNPNNYPLWSTANSEMIVEEIIRTLAGSIGLILAVPLTTVIAAWYLGRRSPKQAGAGRSRL